MYLDPLYFVIVLNPTKEYLLLTEKDTLPTFASQDVNVLTSLQDSLYRELSISIPLLTLQDFPSVSKLANERNRVEVYKIITLTYPLLGKVCNDFISNRKKLNWASIEDLKKVAPNLPIAELYKL